MFRKAEKENLPPLCQQRQTLYFGSSSWTRTNDPAVNSRMLYQLSYWGMLKYAGTLPTWILSQSAYILYRESAGLVNRFTAKNLSIFFCIFRLTILSEYYILLKSHRTKPNCVKVARQTLTLFVRVRILLRLPHCPETLRFRGFFCLFPMIDPKKRPLVP